MKTLIIGAGKIGRAIAKILYQEGGYPLNYEISVADVSQAALDNLSVFSHNDSRASLDVPRILIPQPFSETIGLVIKGYQIVVSACSFQANMEIAAACAREGASYFDLTEDVLTTKFVKTLAANAANNQIFMPQCGLAPGYVGIVGNHLAKKFETVEKLEMRVGALPMYPSNAMKYNLTWSTDGLINEYCNPCEALVDGRQVELPALEGLERFSVDGVEYEAFNTSGGLGTLCETYKDKVRYMSYKTARYPGHRDLMDFLINGLKFRDRRGQLKDLFDNVIPLTKQDVVLIFCTATGWRQGRLEQESFVQKVYSNDIYDQHMSAIQITTAAGLCTVLDLYQTGKLPNKGFVRQEDIKYEDFRANRFGAWYEFYSRPKFGVK